MSTALASTLRRTVTRHEPLVWLLAAAALMSACLAGFLHLANEVVEGQTAGLDASIADGFHASATGWLTEVFLAITFLGNSTTLLAVAIVAAAATIALRRISDAALVLLALAGSSSLNMIVKVLVARDRPEFADPIATAHGYSFPSGHAMTSAVVYGVVAYLIVHSVRSTRLRAAIVASFAVLVGMIGLSRLYLGVHFLTDVAAGYLLGVAWLMACLIAAGVAAHPAGPTGRRRGQVASVAPVATIDSTKIPSSTR